VVCKEQVVMGTDSPFDMALDDPGRLIQETRIELAALWSGTSRGANGLS
jgi:hypothetical protein